MLFSRLHLTQPAGEMAMDTSRPVVCTSTDSLRPEIGGKPKQPGTGKKSPHLDATTSVSARARTGGRSTKTKQKSSRTMSRPIHPSVGKARAWTNKAEQAEELRAREARYVCPSLAIVSISSSSASGPIASTITQVAGGLDDSSRGGDVRAGVATGNTEPARLKRAKRPWEWSAKECRDLLGDAGSSQAQDVVSWGGARIGGCDGEASQSFTAIGTHKEPVNVDSGRKVTTTTGAQVCPADARGRSRSRSSDRSRRFLGGAGNSYSFQDEELLETDRPQPLRSKRASGNGVDLAPDREVKEDCQLVTSYPIRKRSMPTPFNPSVCSDRGRRTSIAAADPQRGKARSGRGYDQEEDEADDIKKLGAALNRNHPRRGTKSEDQQQQPQLSLSSFTISSGSEERERVEPIGRGSLRVRRIDDAGDGKADDERTTFSTRRKH